jgi:CHAT domain-containing protein/tetratricopeptide (TPR) repeat protein
MSMGTVANINQMIQQVYQLQSMGRFKESVPVAERAVRLAIEDVGQDDPLTAEVINALGLSQCRLGNFKEAEKLYRQAMDVIERRLGERSQEFVRQLNNLGELYDTVGRHKDAEAQYARCVEIGRAVLDPHDPDLATLLNNLAEFYRGAGRYGEAEPLYREAMEIERGALGDRNPDYAITVANMGILYREMENFVGAEVYYRKALEIWQAALPPAHPQIALGLNNLGELHSAMGRHGEAETCHRQALEIRRRSLGERHPLTAASLGNLATALSHGDRHAEARDLYEESLAILAEHFRSPHPGLLVARNNMAAMDFATGDFLKAARALDGICAEAKALLGPAHRDTIGAIYTRALALTALGEVPQAFSAWRDLAASDDALIGEVSAMASENERLTYLANVQFRLDASLSFVLRYLANSAEASRWAYDLVLRRKGLAATALAVRRESVLGGRYPALRQKLDELGRLRQATARMVWNGPSNEDPSGFWARFYDLEIEKDRLEGELARSIPEMHVTRQTERADSEAVRSALPPGAVLVEFLRFTPLDFDETRQRVPGDQWKPARYLAFVSEPDGAAAPRILDLGDAAAVDRLIDRYRSEIAGGGRSGQDVGKGSGSDGRRGLGAEGAPAGETDGAGHELRKLVWDPLAPHVRGASMVVVSPDGELAKLPLEILPLEEGGYLIDRMVVQYVGVGRDLLRWSTVPNAEATAAMVVAAPRFDLTAERSSLPAASPSTADPEISRGSALRAELVRFSDLPGTEAEGRIIGDLLGVTPLTGEKALERALKSASSPRILHVATHGFFLKSTEEAAQLTRSRSRLWHAGDKSASRALRDPMVRSGLALAGANTWLDGGTPPPDAEDGILTAADVADLDLAGTELAVLSACETGLGDVRVGEGVFGLRRAFHAAGVRTLVISLWKVPDEQTRDIMVEFYRQILDKRPRAQALREARLKTKARHPAPRDWGAFICEGDPGTLA